MINRKGMDSFRVGWQLQAAAEARQGKARQGKAIWRPRFHARLDAFDRKRPKGVGKEK